MPALIVTIGLAVVSFFFCIRWPTRGFLCILFLLPFSVALNPLPGVDLQLLRLLVPAWWLAVLVRRPRGFLKEAKAPLVLAWGFFCTVVALSLFVAQEAEWGIRKLVYLWSFAPALPAMIVVLREKRLQLTEFLRPLFAGGAVISVIGIAQFVSQFFFGTNTPFHFFVKLLPYTQGAGFGELVAQFPSWFVDIGGVTYLRAFGFFPDPHIFAFYLVMVSSLLLALLLNAQTKKAFLYYVTCYMLHVTCLTLTFSRGGYLGFLASSAVVFALSYRRTSRRATLLLASSVVAVVMLAAFGAPMVGRLASSFDIVEGSNAGRLAIWRDALQQAGAHPFGIGLGNYAVAAGATGIRSPITAHNLYLDILVETGIFGLIAFVGFLFFVCKLSARLASLSLRRSGSGEKFADTHMLHSAGVLGVLTGFSVHAFFENPFYAPAILFLFLFLGAWAYTHAPNSFPA